MQLQDVVSLLQFFQFHPTSYALETAFDDRQQFLIPRRNTHTHSLHLGHAHVSAHTPGSSHSITVHSSVVHAKCSDKLSAFVFVLVCVAQVLLTFLLASLPQRSFVAARGPTAWRGAHKTSQRNLFEHLSLSKSIIPKRQSTGRIIGMMLLE